MKRRPIGEEYLVLQDEKDPKKVLALSCGELIYYDHFVEKARWVDTEHIYPVTIKLANAKTEEEKQELSDRVKSSLTYLTFKILCEKGE